MIISRDRIPNPRRRMTDRAIMVKNDFLIVITTPMILNRILSKLSGQVLAVLIKVKGNEACESGKMYPYNLSTFLSKKGIDD
jgi:hypothetical protein